VVDFELAWTCKLLFIETFDSTRSYKSDEYISNLKIVICLLAKMFSN
jgi:hypothetical protein